MKTLAHNVGLTVVNRTSTSVFLTLTNVYLIGLSTALHTNLGDQRQPKTVASTIQRDYFSDGAPGQCPTSPCTAAHLLGKWAGDQIHAGVNLGGWLALEDWFFSEATAGDTRQLVAGYKTIGEGHVFPSPCGMSASYSPIVNASWQSEGLLTTWLRDKYDEGRGPDPIELFGQHRETFITYSDFEQIAALGLKKVRVPIPWQMFADALCNTRDAFFQQYCHATVDSDAKLVPDPYYSANITLVTIPRKLVYKRLLWAEQHNLQVVFDLHTMPGGSSDGTYSSAWPFPPAFWHQTVRNITLRNMGLIIVDALMDWVAELGSLKNVVTGFTFLNEPAAKAQGGKAFGGAEWLNDQEDVFAWLRDAGSRFEKKKDRLAPSAKLYMNLHMSAFQPQQSKLSTGTDPPTHPAYVWFREEYGNKPWAVLDVHWYGAWVEKPPPCDEDTIDDLIAKFSNFMQQTWLGNLVFSNMSLEGRMAASELSAATFHAVALACRNITVLRSFAHKQIVHSLDHGVEPFFWTWRMPEGGIFQDGWSLKKIAGYEKETHGRFCND